MSEPRELVVIGGGEHARVVIDAALSEPGRWRLLGFLDPAECPATARMFGLRRLGGDESLLPLVRAERAPLFALGVGGLPPGSMRPAIVERYATAGALWATIVHARACVSPATLLDDGVFVAAGAVVGPGARVDRFAIINTGAVVEHDVELGPFAHVAPGAVIGGGARIGDGAHVGLGSRVRDHVSIGPNCLVGMGATVVRDVAPGTTVVGTPARPRGASDV